jgi:hypothetical protein
VPIVAETLNQGNSLNISVLFVIYEVKALSCPT